MFRLPLIAVVTLALSATSCSTDDPSTDALQREAAPAAPPGSHVVDRIPAIELDASNTGLRGAINLGLFPGDPDDPYAGLERYQGDVVIDDAWLAKHNRGSRTVEGIDVEGGVVIATDDVTLRYCRIQADENVLYGLQNNGPGDGSGFELAWCDVSFANGDGKAVLGRNFTIYRSFIQGGQDGIHVNDGGASPGGVVIEQNVVRDQLRPEGHHSDGIQFNGDPGGPVLITGNKVINHLEDANAPIMLSGVEEILVEENYLFGGVYYLVGGIDGTLVSRNNQLAWASTLFGMYGVSGDVEVSGDTWAEWVDPEAIDAAGNPIEPPVMPAPGDIIGTAAIDDAPGDP